MDSDVTLIVLLCTARKHPLIVSLPASVLQGERGGEFLIFFNILAAHQSHRPQRESNITSAFNANFVFSFHECKAIAAEKLLMLCVFVWVGLFLTMRGTLETVFQVV